MNTYTSNKYLKHLVPAVNQIPEKVEFYIKIPMHRITAQLWELHWLLVCLCIHKLFLKEIQKKSDTEMLNFLLFSHLSQLQHPQPVSSVLLTFLLQELRDFWGWKSTLTSQLSTRFSWVFHWSGRAHPDLMRFDAAAHQCVAAADVHLHTFSSVITHRYLYWFLVSLMKSLPRVLVMQDT